MRTHTRTLFEYPLGKPLEAKLLKEPDYARDASAAAATAADATAACALRQSCEGCQSTAPGRVVQCVRGVCCAVCVRRSHTPQSPELDFYFFADRSRLQRKKTVHRAPASACCSSRQSTRWCHRCCIFCTLSGLRRMTLPAFAAASRWHSLDARAMPLVRNE